MLNPQSLQLRVGVDVGCEVERNDCPYAPSRSPIRYRGAVSHGRASRICCATQSALGCAAAHDAAR